MFFFPKFWRTFRFRLYKFKALWEGKVACVQYRVSGSFASLHTFLPMDCLVKYLLLLVCYDLLSSVSVFSRFSSPIASLHFRFSAVFTLSMER